MIKVDNNNIILLNKIYDKNYSVEEMIKYQKNFKYERHPKIPYNVLLNYPDHITRKEIFETLKTNNCHIGQLKLFNCLFEYLTLLKKKGILDDSLVLYIGSAVGSNIYVASLFFHNVKFLLYDPAKFDRRLFNSNNIIIKTRKDGYWSLEKIPEAKRIMEENNKKYIVFISDIRIETDDERVMKDNLLNVESILGLNAISYMLKLKVPYKYAEIPSYFKGTLDEFKNYTKKISYIDFTKYKDKIKNTDLSYNENEYLYIDGKIYYQIFAPETTAETRLIGFRNKNYKLKRYNINEYEYKNFNFNMWRNFFIYNKFKTNELYNIMKIANEDKYVKTWVPTYENITELYILYKYLILYDKFKIMDFNKKYEIMKSIMQSIYDSIGFIFEKRIACVKSSRNNDINNI